MTESQRDALMRTLDDLREGVRLMRDHAPMAREYFNLAVGRLDGMLSALERVHCKCVPAGEQEGS